MSNYIRLPYPVSTNRYWRRVGHRTIVSKEAIEYKRLTALALKQQGCKHHGSADVCVTIVILPKMNKDGTQSKNLIDIDNGIKVTLDALNWLAYDDDRQVKRLYVSYGDMRLGGGLLVKITDC